MQEGAVEYLMNWRAGLPCGPYNLNVRPTDFCNLLCKSCDKGLDREDRSIDFSRELSDQQLLQLVKDAADIGVQYLHIDGGEPLLRREITLGMMAEAKRRGMVGFLVTNGTLFTKKDIRTVVDIGWDRILFSIDGPDAETHDFLRGVPGCFDCAVRNIKQLVSYRREQEKETPHIGLATVLSNANYNKIDAMIRLAHSLHLDGTYLQPLYTNTPSAYTLLLSERQKAEFQVRLPELKKLSEELGVDTNLRQFKDPRLVTESNQLGEVIIQEAQHALSDFGEHFLAVPCYTPWMYLGVRPDGTVAPCPIVPPHVCGYLSLNEQSLKDIWFGPFFTEFRRRILEHNLYPFCKTCCGGIVADTRDYRERLVECLKKEKGDMAHR